MHPGKREIYPLHPMSVTDSICQTHAISERKISRSAFKRFRFRLAGSLVNRVSVNKNSFERLRRTGVLAGSAAYADVIIHFRDEKLAFVRLHVTCLCGAMFRAGPANGFLRFNYTIILDENGLAYPGQFFGLKHKGHDGAGWTNLCTESTFVIAEAFVKIHSWLHYTSYTILAH